MNRNLLFGRRLGRRRRPNLAAVSRLDERPLERKLERRPAERLHHVVEHLEIGRVRTRRLDADAEDRQPQELLPEPVSQPQTRTGSGLEQHQIGLLTLGQLALADRSVTEPQDEELQQRPVGRIGIDDQDGRHEAQLSPTAWSRRLIVV